MPSSLRTTAQASKPSRATVEHFDDPESMSNEVGALPDMFDQALATYQGSYVLVATDLTSGA